MKIINAVIKSANIALVYDDRYLKFAMELKLSRGGGVVFGNELYSLYQDNQKTNYAGKYICKVLAVVEATSIKDLEGKPVRAIFEKEGRLGDKIIGIQNFLHPENFFIPNTPLSKEEVEKLISEE